MPGKLLLSPCVLLLCLLVLLAMHGKVSDAFSFNRMRAVSSGTLSHRELCSRQIVCNTALSVTNSDISVVAISSRKKRTLNPLKLIVSFSAKTIVYLLETITNMFPLLVMGSTVIGYAKPALFAPYTPHISKALALTMAMMGLTLTTRDITRVIMQPQYVLLGFVAQYTIMPLLASKIAAVAELGPALSSGLILVGCAPGGTASNLVTLIARADVALSVTMTACSTLAAAFFTPALTSRLASQYVSIDRGSLVKSTIEVVLAPVIGGLFVNTFVPQFGRLTSKLTPALSVVLVALICGTISASNAALLPKTAVQVLRDGFSLSNVEKLYQLVNKRLVLSVIALHTGGFLLGYLLSKLSKTNEAKARAISIETGMQNSALAAVLAQSMPNPALTALPACISATCHSVLGSLLAAVWRMIDKRNSFLSRYALRP